MVKGDCSRMFESIPHTGVIEALLWKFDIALEEMDAKYSCIDSYTGKHRWVKRKKTYGHTSEHYTASTETCIENLIETQIEAAVDDV